MYRYLENLVDPYVDFPEVDAPPTRLGAFMRDYSKPFKKLFWIAGALSVVVAAVEVGLIYYMGHVVDVLSSGEPAQVMSEYGGQLGLIALFILVLRPFLQGLDVAILNNAILPNYGTLYRWRAHKHVLRQSVGWFENDFAGRIANRIMQAPPFQVFDAITFSFAYLLGAAIMLGEVDPRLMLPLAIWFALYVWLMTWTMKRVGPASQASSNARSMTTGRVVDSYTNIHSVKLFAHHDRELEFAKEEFLRQWT